eukprot:Polyplicarium_translucidae@DN1227_c0_g1_i3.p1
MSLPEVWDFWIEDARQWAKHQFPEAYAKQGLSAVMTLYVHADSDENAALDLPEAFEDSLVERTTCNWGATVPCMLRVLEAAVEGRRGMEPSSRFIFVSGSTIPVKPFSFIYSSLLRNQRSRFAFSNVNLTPVKHHQWVVLSREHAMVLVENGELWKLKSKWISHKYPSGKTVVAADDEHSTFEVLEEVLGRDVAMAGINDGTPLPPPEDTAPLPYEMDQFQTTWVCWDPACTVGRSSAARPMQFTEIDMEKFHAQIWSKKGLWFARKFASDATLIEPFPSIGPLQEGESQPKGALFAPALGSKMALLSSRLSEHDVHAVVM